MQETHLKKTEKTDVLATLKAFEVGESEFISYADSQTDITYWRSRYTLLRKQSLLTSRFQFHSGCIEGKDGVLIMRVA